MLKKYVFVVISLLSVPAMVIGCAATASSDIDSPQAPDKDGMTAPPLLGIGSVQISDKDGMTLLYVPAGEFTMGSNSGNANEKPEHKVFLDAFWIDQTEVTNAMFRQFVAATGYRTDAGQKSPGPSSNLEGDKPVVEVSWNDAEAYCSWAGRRLPTEAEWEKAARGTDGRIYPWGNQPPDDTQLSVYTMEYGSPTTRVGSHPAGASPYGALDMVGHVDEWVADWYSETYYTSSPYRNPTGPTSGDTTHVLRGGVGLDYGTPDVRASFRTMDHPSGRVQYVGFRCAR
jgi:formylglycine-generating enzyme required for sulfatase activity